MSRKDLILSIILHLVLTGVILIISPAIGMFKPRVEIMRVPLVDALPGGPPAGKAVSEKETTKINPPPAGEPMPDESIAEKPILKTDSKKEKIEKKKPEPKKPEPEEKTKPEPNTPHDSEQESNKVEDQQPKEDGKGGLDVASAVGGSGTGIGRGSSNLPYNLGLVLNIIERNWRNPVSSPKPISCTVYFQIDRSGSLIGQPVVERSSGFSTFDQAAVYAVIRAGQFPAFPSNFNYEYIGLHLDFEYVPGK
jgi:TonB family protein